MDTQCVSVIIHSYLIHHYFFHPFSIFSYYDRKGESVTLKGHTGAVRSVKFGEDNRNLITASDDKTAKVD